MLLCCWAVEELGEVDVDEAAKEREGTVWGWLPAEESEYFPEFLEEGQPGPLWRVKFSSDIAPADLDEIEMEHALNSYREWRRCRDAQVQVQEVEGAARVSSPGTQSSAAGAEGARPQAAHGMPAVPSLAALPVMQRVERGHEGICDDGRPWGTDAQDGQGAENGMGEGTMAGSGGAGDADEAGQAGTTRRTGPCAKARAGEEGRPACEHTKKARWHAPSLHAARWLQPRGRASAEQGAGLGTGSVTDREAAATGPGLPASSDPLSWLQNFAAQQLLHPESICNPKGPAAFSSHVSSSSSSLAFSAADAGARAWLPSPDSACMRCDEGGAASTREEEAGSGLGLQRPPSKSVARADEESDRAIKPRCCPVRGWNPADCVGVSVNGKTLGRGGWRCGTHLRDLRRTVSHVMLCALSVVCCVFHTDTPWHRSLRMGRR